MPRILVVDDLPDNRLLLSNLLAQAGLEVKTAENSIIASEINNYNA